MKKLPEAGLEQSRSFNSTPSHVEFLIAVVLCSVTGAPLFETDSSSDFTSWIVLSRSRKRKGSSCLTENISRSPWHHHSLFEFCRQNDIHSLLLASFSVSSTATRTLNWHRLARVVLLFSSYFVIISKNNLRVPSIIPARNCSCVIQLFCNHLRIQPSQRLPRKHRRDCRCSLVEGYHHLISLRQQIYSSNMIFIVFSVFLLSLVQPFITTVNGESLWLRNIVREHLQNWHLEEKWSWMNKFCTSWLRLIRQLFESPL